MMTFMRIVWRLGFWIPFGFTTYMALTPVVHPEVPQTNDKVMHLLAFGYLTGAFAIAYTHWTTWQRTAGIMFAYAAFIEMAQALIPNRYASLLDLAADSTGILLALSGLYIMNRVAGLWRPETEA